MPSNISKTQLRDSFCIQTDSTMKIGKPDVNTIHSVQGSPRLLKDGLFVVNKTIECDQLGTDIWANNALLVHNVFCQKSCFFSLLRTDYSHWLRNILGYQVY